MHSGHRFVPARKAIEALLLRAQGLLARGDYAAAEALAAQALNDWRAAAAPREEEGELVSTLGKCLMAQRKYSQAYDLYMPALSYLTGAGYDEVYANFVYLNERMGTFHDSKPSPRDEVQSEEPNYPAGYYDDFEKK
ncbi:MAG: hypothetical protein JSS86_13040 [Cyanobacteria bacterium SZAS LIN-2]|nr:hypothetical protein [Cyanobacteria bacterium SZAS LIN-2]